MWLVVFTRESWNFWGNRMRKGWNGCPPPRRQHVDRYSPDQYRQTRVNHVSNMGNQGTVTVYIVLIRQSVHESPSEFCQILIGRHGQWSDLGQISWFARIWLLLSQLCCCCYCWMMVDTTRTVHAANRFVDSSFFHVIRLPHRPVAFALTAEKTDDEEEENWKKDLKKKINWHCQEKVGYFVITSTKYTILIIDDMIRCPICPLCLRSMWLQSTQVRHSPTKWIEGSGQSAELGLADKIKYGQK